MGLQDVPALGSAVEASDDDFARDALHILPLRIIPLETPGLQRARLIKNVRLENVIEMFNDQKTGSGQVKPENITAYFDSYEREIEHDMVKIRNICQASSFDVYTMRIELRRLAIDINSQKELSLSESKKQELTEYMKSFTRPLVRSIYGLEAMEVNDVDDLIAMFAHPNREEALRNLKKMAEKLRIELHEIPTFLEEYGDIFLSLAYFKRCIDQIVPEIQRFITWMNECLGSREVQNNPKVERIIHDISNDLTDVSTSITGRFESFDQRSRDFWNDINADTFRKVRDLIKAHHVTIGGVLCGLAVKMDLWKTRFARGGGGPTRRVEFIKSEILPGLGHIRSLENSARTIKDP